MSRRSLTQEKKPPKKSTSLYMAEDTKKRLKEYGRQKRIGSISRVVEYIAWNDIKLDSEEEKTGD